MRYKTLLSSYAPAAVAAFELIFCGYKRKQFPREISFLFSRAVCVSLRAQAAEAMQEKDMFIVSRGLASGEICFPCLLDRFIFSLSPPIENCHFLDQ